MAPTSRFSPLVLLALCIGAHKASALPPPLLPNQQARAVEPCTQAALDSAIAAFLGKHPGWNVSFAREPVTEQNDDFLKQVSQTEGMTGLCSYYVNVTPSPDVSDNTFGFELALPPADRWNSRFLTVGNSAFLGTVNRLTLANGLAHACATMGTDTGHHSTEAWDQSWATNPAKRTDWAYRALDRSVALAKLMVEAYYGNAARYSYFTGCSTGGRQGLKQVTVDPTSFDGILVGAPPWSETWLAGWVTYIRHMNDQLGPDKLTIDDYPVIDDYVLDQCDNAGGVKEPPSDGIIADVASCHANINWTDILCVPGQAGRRCLSQPKLDMVQLLLSDIHNDKVQDPRRNKLLYHGYSIASAREWDTWLGAGFEGKETAYERSFLGMGDDVSWARDESAIIAALEKGDEVAVNDLSQLKYGGKILLYHGTADGFIPHRGSQFLYEETQRRFPDAADWFRYFEIPGMQHCGQALAGFFPSSGKPAPYYIGGDGQAAVLTQATRPDVPPEVRVDGPTHDALAALWRWVEGATPPALLVATAWQPGTTTYRQFRQRPICPYPDKAQWKGGDDNPPDDANSYTCGTPPVSPDLAP